MTLIFIKNLGITRLREVARILKIPGYTLYDDPNALRNHIMKYLTKQYYVRQKHLDEIGKSQAEIDMLVRHLRDIAKEYKKRQSSPLKRSMTSLASRLQECGGVCPDDLKVQLPADVSSKLSIASASRKTFPLVMNASPVASSISPVALSAAPLPVAPVALSASPTDPINEDGVAATSILPDKENSLDEAKKQLYAEKVQAIKDLEDAQKKIELYQTELKKLDQILGSDSSLEDISSALSKIMDLQTELSSKIESVKTQETIIAALQAQMGDQSSTPTLFEKESRGMMNRVTELDQKTQNLIQEVARHVKTIEDQKRIITDQDQTIQMLNIEQEQHVAKIQAQVKEIQQCNVSSQECAQKLDQLQQRIDLLSNQLVEQKFNVDKLEAENKRFGQQLQTVAYGDEKELGEMKKYVADMMVYLSKATGKIARLEGVGEVKEVKDSLAKLRDIKTWPEFKLSLDDLSKQINDLRKATKNAEVKGENVDQIKILRETLADANAKVAQLEDQVKQMALQDKGSEQKVAPVVEVGQPPALVPPTQIPVVQQPQPPQFPNRLPQPPPQFPNRLPQPPPRDPGWFGFFRREPKEEVQGPLGSVQGPLGSVQGPSSTQNLVPFQSREISPQRQGQGWLSGWFGSNGQTNPAGVNMKDNPYGF